MFKCEEIKRKIRDIISAYYISRVLGFSVLYECKLTKLTDTDCYCFDGPDIPPPPPQPSPQESMEGIMKAIIKYYPEYLEMISKYTPGFERAMTEVTSQLAPLQAQTALDIFRQYGPEFAQAGSDIIKQQMLNQAAAEAAVLRGPGAEVVSAAREAERAYDPIKEAAREAILSKAAEFVNNLNTSGGLSGSERAELERVLNRENIQRGTYNTPSNISTLENAMKFGQELQRRQAAINQNLQMAAATAQALTKPVDVFNVATGRPVMANWGQQQYVTPSFNPQSNTAGYLGGMFNTAANLQTTAMGTAAENYGAYTRALTTQQSPFAQVMGGLTSLGGFLWGSNTGPLARFFK